MSYPSQSSSSRPGWAPAALSLIAGLILGGAISVYAALNADSSELPSQDTITKEKAIMNTPEYGNRVSD